MFLMCKYIFILLFIMLRHSSQIFLSINPADKSLNWCLLKNYLVTNEWECKKKQKFYFVKSHQLLKVVQTIILVMLLFNTYSITEQNLKSINLLPFWIPNIHFQEIKIKLRCPFFLEYLYSSNTSLTF